MATTTPPTAPPDQRRSRGFMAALTNWVLGHKRVVLGFWLAVFVAAVAALAPAGGALSQQFSVPGREGFEANLEIAAIYGSGGDVAPLVPVVRLPNGKTVDSPGAREQLAAALAKVQGALPQARIASYASTGDRAFVSEDGRTTFALVYIPAKGGVDQGLPEARLAQAALAGTTVAGHLLTGHSTAPVVVGRHQPAVRPTMVLDRGR